MYINLKNNAEDLCKLLDPISSSPDKLQSRKVLLLIDAHISGSNF